MARPGAYLPVEFVESIEKTLRTVNEYEDFLQKKLKDDVVAVQGQQRSDDVLLTCINNVTEKLQNEELTHEN